MTVESERLFAGSDSFLIWQWSGGGTIGGGMLLVLRRLPCTQVLTVYAALLQCTPTWPLTGYLCVCPCVPGVTVKYQIFSRRLSKTWPGFLRKRCPAHSSPQNTPTSLRHGREFYRKRSDLGSRLRRGVCGSCHCLPDALGSAAFAVLRRQSASGCSETSSRGVGSWRQ